MSDSAPIASPFSKKLGTNYCPKDEEVAEIQALLVEPTLRMERLDNEIATLWKTIDTLTAEREGIDAYVAAHKALISPVRRLPLDIIQEIFIACMPTHRNCVMSAREAPVLLGRICSSWRAISLATPRLWASLHIVEPIRPVHSFPYALFEAKLTQRLETAKTWLNRSGQCPLSISLEGCAAQWGMPHSPPAPPRTGLFLEALMIFAPRWQHVSFRVTYVALETLGRLAESDVPVLESIDLSPYQSSSLPQFDWGRFTMLHGARVSGFYILGNDFRAADLPLRWHLLTHLSILGPTRVQYVPGGLEPISSETALQTISRCPALRSCELRLVDEPEAAMHAQGLMVEHPFIDTFEVFCVGRGVGDTFRLLLDNLFLPQLRKLTLRIYFPRLHGQTQGSDTIPPLLRFLASSTHLGTLDLDTATFSKSSLLEILDNLPPSVQHLRLDDNPRLDGWGPPQTEYSGLDDDVLQAFATTPYCPALQTLHIQSSSTISDGGLLNFITTRMLVCPLRRVQIDFSREIQHDITPGLQPIIDGGLEVQITYPHVIPVHFSPWEGLPDGLLEH